MDDEITINTIEWSAPEYTHKERSNDWFWTIGVITIVSCGIALWLHNYIFAIFILISGCCLIMFTIREPEEVKFIIETKGFTMGKDLYLWKNIKSFNIKINKENVFSKLIIETNKKFLPIYTIPTPTDKINDVKEALLKVSKRSEINESQSMLFAEKLGF